MTIDSLGTFVLKTTNNLLNHRKQRIMSMTQFTKMLLKCCTHVNKKKFKYPSGVYRFTNFENELAFDFLNALYHSQRATRRLQEAGG